MLKSLSSNNQTVFDIVNIVAGLGLLVSPWLLGFTAETYAIWNAVIAAAALYAFYEAEEWVNLVLGIWAVAAPWVLGFAGVTAATWVHVVAGIVVAVLAAGNIWFGHNGGGFADFGDADDIFASFFSRRAGWRRIPVPRSGT